MEKISQGSDMAGIRDIWKNIRAKVPVNVSFGKKKISIKVVRPEASSGSYNSIFTVNYDGEKNLGEIGPIKNYYIDYPAIRMRSWQSYLESEISQAVLNKFAIWVIGSGLKLQAEPAKKVLKSEGVDLDTEAFNDTVESRFAVYSGSKKADYSNMQNLHAKASEAFINSIIGGDVLVVLRLVNGHVKVQLIDGAHVGSPLNNTSNMDLITSRGNRVRNGIEISKTGEHVAYWVRKTGLDYERIPAKGRKSGMKMAFMVYGMEYRIDNTRGIPLISAVLETLKKLERYKEATVGSAEERQKIVMQIVHEAYSTGENPLQGVLAKAMDADAVVDDIPTDKDGDKLADMVAATTNKQVFNMPQGAEMKGLESKNELYFKDFYQMNIDIVCAALGIPPEVALSKYDSNFSASRAALKDWEHTINVNRKRFASAFYQNVYDFWLEVQILNNKVKAPGYLLAKGDNNMILDSYRMARFVGATIPHIDPEKEVKAVRQKLGEKAKDIPLTTVEAATEELNGGDSNSNLEQYSRELEKSKELGISEASQATAPNEGGQADP